MTCGKGAAARAASDPASALSLAEGLTRISATGEDDFTRLCLTGPGVVDSGLAVEHSSVKLLQVRRALDQHHPFTRV